MNDQTPVLYIVMLFIIVLMHSCSMHNITQQELKEYIDRRFSELQSSPTIQEEGE